MITTKDLKGRLGNQMFQIAAAYSLAKENNDEFVLPLWDNQKYFKVKHRSFFHPSETVENQYMEPGFHYSKILYQKNLILDGYFQSYKYFTPEILREIFEPEDNISLDVKLSGKFFPSSEACSIHVRRGDYLKYPLHHPLCSEAYFKEAIDIMYSKHGITNFLICSDDIEWCKTFFGGFKSNLSFLYSESHYMADFSFLQNTDHNIISNSSFSMLAAMLNKNSGKVVISPSKDNWHGSAYAHWNHDDLIPPDWIQIKY